MSAALASGEWRAKTDPKSGRTFYTHTHTKRSVWNLQKELEKAGGEKRAVDGLQPEEVVASEERSKISREERQQKMQARAAAELKLREDIERLEQSNQVLELEIANLKGPVQSEAAQVEELKRILADHEVSMHEVETELGVRREQKNNELLQLQSRIGLLESQLESQEQFRESIRARYDKMTAESMELKSDLSREETAALQIQAQIRETEAKTHELKARLQLQRTDIANEEEAIKLIEDDVRALAMSKARLAGEIQRRKQELEQAKKRRADEKAAAAASGSDARSARNSQHAMKNLESVLAAREKELAQLMEADALLEKNGALERCNQNLRAVLKASIRDEEALQRLAELLERENQKLAEAVAAAREEKHRIETARRQFRLKFMTDDPNGEFASMCLRWSQALQDKAPSVF